MYPLERECAALRCATGQVGGDSRSCRGINKIPYASGERSRIILAIMLADFFMSRPLPVREGISPSAVFLPEGTWPTALAFLIDRFPDVGEARWRARMSGGRVVWADGCCVLPDAPFRARERIFYYRELEQEPRIPFEESVLFENDHIVVADKPHFLPTAPVGQYLQETLLVRLKRRLGLAHLVPLHRLDRETAGLVLLSKEVATRDAYHALFRQDGIVKTYEAIARFNPAHEYPVTRRSRIERAERFYRREEVEGEVNAVSVIDLIERQGEWARYRLQPVTGKTHQLRVHMAALGMPIRNDALYPCEQPRNEDAYAKPLQLLAKTLTFRDPVTGGFMAFESRYRLAEWHQNRGI